MELNTRNSNKRRLTASFGWVSGVQLTCPGLTFVWLAWFAWLARWLTCLAWLSWFAWLAWSAWFARFAWFAYFALLARFGINFFTCWLWFALQAWFAWLTCEVRSLAYSRFWVTFKLFFGKTTFLFIFLCFFKHAFFEKKKKFAVFG